jgi:hypothetical protein
MRLRSQLLQGHLSVFHRIALRAESRVAQTGAAVFVRRALAVAKASAAVCATLTGAAVARATPAGITTAAISAVTRTRTAAGHCGRIFFHPRAVVAAHGHHRADGLGRCHGGWGGGCHRCRRR